MDDMKVILKKENGIGVVILNDPEHRNILSVPMVEALEKYLDECNTDPEIRVVVLRGAGKAFSAGGNLNAMKERVDTGNAKAYGEGVGKLGKAAVKIRHLRKPVIASIHGAAAGGGLNLALACDFRVVAQETKLVFSFANIGLIPDLGGPLPLLRSIGVARTTELLMTGRMFSAAEALDWGLINEVVPLDQLEAATMRLAAKLAGGATVSYGYIKAMINQLAFHDLEAEIRNEAEYQAICAATADHKEGVYAFLEKRTPVFRGK
jgi:enoyl-CoA hydratase/carnithine racemase